MALYTYNINSDWTYVEDTGLPGLWYGYKHVKFVEDTTLHTQTNYYRFSVFMKIGDIYAQYKDDNYNVKTRVAIPATIKSYRLKTYWYLPNAVNSTIQVSGLGSVSVSSSNNFVPVWLEGSNLAAQNAPEGFTKYTKVRYLLNNVEIVANCHDTYGAGQFGFELSGGQASTGSNTTDTPNVNLSQFLTSGSTSSGTAEWYVNFIRSSGAIVGTVRPIYLPYKANRSPSSVSSSVNLTTGEVKITFSTMPLAATGFKVWISSQAMNLNSAYPYVYSFWLEDVREIPAQFFEESSFTYSFTLTETERFNLFELADEFGVLDESTGQIQMRVDWLVYTGFYPPEDNESGVEFIYVSEKKSGNYLTLIGRAPDVDGEVYDINAKTIALTGNRDTLIRYHSTAYYTITAEAKDSATLSQLNASNAGSVKTGPTGQFQEVESNIFHLDAIDNRGNISRKTIEKGWVEYIKLTANIKSNEISADGYASIVINGNYYGGSFGLVDNALTLSVRYKTGDSEYSEWINVQPSIGSNGTYEHTIKLEGLDYTETYTFQAKAKDALEEILSGEKVFTTIPVFDWGHDDFNFNVPVTIQGKRLGENTVLWSGSSTLGNGASVELSEPISAQFSGVVLVFSPSGSDSWNMEFIPKTLVALNNGGSHVFLMASNAILGKFGVKNVNIFDTQIVGNALNESSSTGSSITYANADFVLRYVIGV